MLLLNHKWFNISDQVRENMKHERGQNSRSEQEAKFVQENRSEQEAKFMQGSHSVQKSESMQDMGQSVTGLSNKKDEQTKMRRLKYFEKQKKLQQELNLYGGDILHSENFLGSHKNIQHGTVSVKEHSLNVARKSLEIVEALHISCDKKDLVRGALLHDYFLYDWHYEDPGDPHKLHGFYHPARALKNAEKEYDLDDCQRDIIKKHMWPLTIKPPTYVEGWVVTCADKYCSLAETLHMQKGSRRKYTKYIDLSDQER